MKHPGPAQKKSTFGSQIKAMASVMNPTKVILPDIRLPKQRRRPCAMATPNKREEDAFRKILVDHLKKNGCVVRRIEPCVRGKFGVPDILVLCLKTKWGGFVEAKSLTGKLSEDQKEIIALFDLCGIGCLVARTLEDVRCIYDIDSGRKTAD